MPYPSEILREVNGCLMDLNKPRAGSLAHIYQTDGEVSCVNLAGAILERFAGDMGENYEYVNATSDNGLVCNIDAIATNGRLIHINVRGEPSTNNHVFNVHIWDNTALIIQVYLNKQVRLFRRISKYNFIQEFNRLRSQNSHYVSGAYNDLFGVTIAPNYTVSDLNVTYV